MYAILVMTYVENPMHCLAHTVVCLMKHKSESERTIQRNKKQRKAHAPCRGQGIASVDGVTSWSVVCE